MSLAVVSSRALFGLDAIPVRVEVHVGSGLPAFNLVGYPARVYAKVGIVSGRPS